jgi:hypothetical protein
MPIPIRCAAGVALGALLGCSPALEWREVRPPGSSAQALFPCKPSSHARTVTLAGAAVEMSLYACAASQVSYALAFTDMLDPALVTPALDELARAAGANLQVTQPAASAPLAVPGMTPNARAASWTLSGRLPDGRPVQEQLALFAYGTRVYQATAVGERLDAAAWESFLAGLKVGP